MCVGLFQKLCPPHCYWVVDRRALLSRLSPIHIWCVRRLRQLILNNFSFVCPNSLNSGYQCLGQRTHYAWIKIWHNSSPDCSFLNTTIVVSNKGIVIGLRNSPSPSRVICRIPTTKWPFFLSFFAKNSPIWEVGSPHICFRFESSYFCDLGAHAKLWNPLTPTSGANLSLGWAWQYQK